jgi:predicted chitinase
MQELPTRMLASLKSKTCAPCHNRRRSAVKQSAGVNWSYLSMLDITAPLAAAAPGADPAVWIDALTTAFEDNDMMTPRRVAAALGQFSAEAGPAFKEISENLFYTSAARISAVFPREFPTLASCQGYMANPAALANRAYAGKLGNGDEASGDGWRYRGRGLIQITGLDEYTALGASVGMTPADAADWCETPEGAAASACWYWNANNLSALADQWQLTAITKAVNGAACEGLLSRISASNAALVALGETLP